MTFQRATKHQSKLRLALAGPAGAGKTYTALTLAIALADGGPVALIDTEHGSASKYADLFQFDTVQLDIFHPKNYIMAIREAEQAGYTVLIIDSLSHAWSGTGGVLEEKDKIAKIKYGGNSFSAWADATAMQNTLVQAILGSKLHIIATVRSKMEYLQEKNEQTGRSTVRKLGMAPVQRDDLPYEFDIFATLESDNTLIIDKSRCPALSGAVIPKPDAKVALILKEWLHGEPAPILQSLPPVSSAVEVDNRATEQQRASIRKLCEHLGKAEPHTDEMSYAEAKQLISDLSHVYRTLRAAQEKAGRAPIKEPGQEEMSEVSHDLATQALMNYIAEVFGFEQKDIAPRFAAYVVHVLGRAIPVHELREEDRTRLRLFATDEEKRRALKHSKGAA